MEPQFYGYPGPPKSASRRFPGVIATHDGSCITRKLRGGKLRVAGVLGCRNNWRRLVRLLDYGIEYERLDPDLMIAFSDATKMKGSILSVIFRWAVTAFGVPIFEELGSEPTLKFHVLPTQLPTG